MFNKNLNNDIKIVYISIGIIISIISLGNLPKEAIILIIRTLMFLFIYTYILLPFISNFLISRNYNVMQSKFDKNTNNLLYIFGNKTAYEETATETNYLNEKIREVAIIQYDKIIYSKPNNFNYDLLTKDINEYSKLDIEYFHVDFKKGYITTCGRFITVNESLELESRIF